MSATLPIEGRLWLRPGRRRPDNLRSTRPDWVRRLTDGLPARRLAGTLASLFSLCGHAHRVCADLAVDAALGGPASVPRSARAAVARQTLREHLHRIWLDWPRQIGDPRGRAAAVDLASRALASYPAAGTTAGETAAWLELHAIGMPLARWLEGWQADPSAWIDFWLRDHDNGVTRLLREAANAAMAWPSTPALRVHADPDALRTWARDLTAAGARAARQPTWQGACAETGVWTRLGEVDPGRLGGPALRLAARVAEAVRLGLDDIGWLRLGALALGPGEAIAWVEMSRGLLMHHVLTEGAGEAARIGACHVIAPTDWNFHPQGAVAQALEACPVASACGGSHRLDILMAAYDPCVTYQTEPARPWEPTHA